MYVGRFQHEFIGGEIIANNYMSSTDLSDKLYRLSDERRYQRLVNLATSHTNEKVRYGASGVLSESSHFLQEAKTDQRKLLLDSIFSDPSDRVRANTIRLLYEIDKSILDAIVVRLAANPQSTPTEDPYPLILNQWHASERAELRLLAVAGFGQVNSHTSAQKLLTAIRKETHLDVLYRAIKEGGKMGHEMFVSPIQGYLRFTDESGSSHISQRSEMDIKKISVTSLVNIGTDAAYEALVTASRSSDEQLKQYALNQIGKFGAEKTVEIVTEELDQTNNADVRKNAAEGVLSTFIESGSEDGHSIREQTISKITETSSVDATSQFSDIVSESQTSVVEKKNAAWLLGQIASESDNKKPIDTLCDVLRKESDTSLSKIAAASLTNYDSNTVRNYIAEILSKFDEGTQEHQLARFVHENIETTAEQAKKNAVEYTYVQKPSDYSSG